MNRREMKKELRQIMESEKGMIYEGDFDEKFETWFLGTVFALDPCGRYHHILSPNGATKRCIAFWERLELAAEEIDAFIESGEGDPCDIFLTRSIES